VKFKDALASLIAASAILAVTALGGVAAAHAATIFTSQAAFNASTSAPGIDAFPDLGAVFSTPSPITRSAGAYSYSAAAETSTFFSAGTVANPWFSTDIATDSITFSGFASTIRGVGGNFFGSNISGLFQLGDILLNLVDSSGATSFTISNATTSSFVGFVSDVAITSLTVSSIKPASGFLWPTVDNFTLAQGLTSAVPEPSTWAMMILGFAGVGFVTYRLSRKVLALA
jgi:hypothetical protein